MIFFFSVFFELDVCGMARSTRIYLGQITFIRVCSCIGVWVLEFYRIQALVSVSKGRCLQWARVRGMGASSLWSWIALQFDYVKGIRAQSSGASFHNQWRLGSPGRDEMTYFSVWLKSLASSDKPNVTRVHYEVPLCVLYWDSWCSVPLTQTLCIATRTCFSFFSLACWFPTWCCFEKGVPMRPLSILFSHRRAWKLEELN